jgi:hypothetical protein
LAGRPPSACADWGVPAQKPIQSGNRFTDDDRGDKLLFGSNIVTSQLWFKRDGNDLDVSIIGTNDQVVIAGWYGSTPQRIDKLQTSDGNFMLESSVQQLVDAMAQFNPPPAGQTELSSDVLSALTPALAVTWQHP